MQKLVVREWITVVPATQANLVVARKKAAIYSRKVGQRKNFVVNIRYFLSFKFSLFKISEEERTTHRGFEAV